MRCAAALVLACLVPPAAGGALAGEGVKTLRRMHDPVVISAARLGALPRRDTAHFRLFRIEGGAPVAIRHQFDARDRDGQLVIDGPADIELDANDELVFMAADAGDRAGTVDWPAGHEAVFEIELTDPRPGQNGRAWAYLVSFPAPPPRPSLEPYVSFDAAGRRARSAAYEVEYADRRNFFTAIRVSAPDGAPGPNLLRQTRMRGSPTFFLLFRNVTLDFTEENSLVDVDGVRVGPVRAIRRARLTIDLGALFPDLPGGVVYTHHYRDAYLTPTQVHFSRLLLAALRDFRFENLMEFAPSALPLRYYDPSQPAGLVLDETSAGGRQSSDDHEWWAHSGGQRTLLHALVIPPAWRDWGVARGTVTRPGGGDGAGLAVGYTLENMTRLRQAGRWDLMQATIVLPGPYRPGDEDDALAMLRAPLESVVRPIPTAGSSAATAHPAPGG